MSDALPSDWIPAFQHVPREAFIPDAIWVRAETGRTPVLRAIDRDAWQNAVRADDSVVTQVDDAGHPSSSCSMPSIVAMMLDRAEIAAGLRVLEIGTGTGWNAALLADRLGDDRVTTVEVDAHLADHARKALAAAGYHPTVVTGDGADGSPTGAPYDRVLATCAVRQVPYPWIEQVRPGGLIITPWGNAFDNGFLLRLVVDDRGGAHGRFVDDTVAFMWLRDQAVTRGWLAEHADDDVTWENSAATVHPFAINCPGAACAVALHLPDCHHRVYDDGEMWLYDPRDGSRATSTVRPEDTTWTVCQHGPQHLWDSAEAAYHWWVDAGRPDHTRFGVSVTSDEQWTWLDGPTNRIAET